MKFSLFIFLTSCAFKKLQKFPINNSDYTLLKNSLIASKEYLSELENKTRGSHHVEKLISIIVDSFFINDMLVFNKDFLQCLHTIDFRDISIVKEDDQEAFHLIFLISSITDFDNLKIITEKNKVNESPETLIFKKLKSLKEHNIFDINLVKNIAKIVISLYKMIDELPMKSDSTKCYETPLYDLYIVNSGFFDFRKLSGGSLFFQKLYGLYKIYPEMSVRFSPYDFLESETSGILKSQTYDYPNLLRKNRLIFLEPRDSDLLLDTFDREVLFHTYMFVVKFISELSLNWCDIKLINNTFNRVLIVKFQKNGKIPEMKSVTAKQFKDEIYKTTYFLSCVELLKAGRELRAAENALRKDINDDSNLNEFKCTAEFIFNNPKVKQTFPAEVTEEDSETNLRIPFRSNLRKRYSKDLLICNSNTNLEELDLNITCISNEKLEGIKRLSKLIEEMIINNNKMRDTGKTILILSFKKWKNRVEKISGDIKEILKNYESFPILISWEENPIIKENILSHKEIKLKFKEELDVFKKVFVKTSKIRELWRKFLLDEEAVIQFYCSIPYEHLNLKQEILKWACANLICLLERSDEEMFDETFYSVISSKHFVFPKNKNEIQKCYEYVKSLTKLRILRSNKVSELCTMYLHEYCNNSGLNKFQN